MAGYPLRVGERRFPAKDARSQKNAERADGLASLRAYLIRLSLDTHTPEGLLDAAVSAISETLNSPCSFLEGEELPKPAPGHTAAVVYADGSPMGALIGSLSDLEEIGISPSVFQELADLVGVGLINASQAQAVAELQNDSEDMLYYAPDVIMVLASDGTVEMANQKALSLVELSSDAVLGRKIGEILGTTDFDIRRLRETAADGGILEVETHGAAGTRLAALTLSNIGETPSNQILCVIRDITNERQAQLAMRRSERSALMGQAVEYLLHEVNNPLAALLSNLGVAKKKSQAIGRCIRNAQIAEPGIEPQLPLLNKILQNAETAAVRIRDTMSTLRSAHVGEGRPGDAQFVNVRAELRMAIGAAEQEASNIEIRSQLETNCRVLAKPLAVAEAVGALLKNALQALDGKRGGEVQVWARERGSRIIVSVIDNGPGVDEAIAERIFMPFFTTKPIKESLGLGLSLAEDMARRLGGTLLLASGNTPGATFELALPIARPSRC